MLRGLVHGLAWSLATGAAVTLSWWGVHTVMAGTAYDPPRAVSIADGGHTATEPLSSSTHRPEPSSSHQAASKKPHKEPSPSHTASDKPSKTKKADDPQSSAPAGTVKSYNTDGGRVVFDLGADSAKLVAATPASGWSMQVWNEPTWIRVEFSKGTDRASVFCTWNDHPPMVQIATY